MQGGKGKGSQNKTYIGQFVAFSQRQIRDTKPDPEWVATIKLKKPKLTGFSHR